MSDERDQPDLARLEHPDPELTRPERYEDVIAEETTGAYLDTGSGPREHPPEGDLPDDFNVRNQRPGLRARLARLLRGR